MDTALKLIPAFTTLTQKSTILKYTYLNLLPWYLLVRSVAPHLLNNRACAHIHKMLVLLNYVHNLELVFL